MADWFVTVEPKVVSDPEPSLVHECIDYRAAVLLANTLAERHPDKCVELVDYEGRIVLAVGVDQFDGAQGWSSIPRRAGAYRWQQASETYRLVSL